MTLALDVKGYSQLNKSINSAAVKDKTGRAKRVNSRIYGGIKTLLKIIPPPLTVHCQLVIPVRAILDFCFLASRESARRRRGGAGNHPGRTLFLLTEVIKLHSFSFDSVESLS